MSNILCVICGEQFGEAEQLFRHNLKLHPASKKPTKKQTDNKVKDYLERARKILLSSKEARNGSVGLNSIVITASMLQREDK